MAEETDNSVTRNKRNLAFFKEEIKGAALKVSLA